MLATKPEVIYFSERSWELIDLQRLTLRFYRVQRFPKTIIEYYYKTTIRILHDLTSCDKSKMAVAVPEIRMRPVLERIVKQSQRIGLYFWAY
jgi:hypothetical protein